jgi:hypothetical protein
VIPWKTIKKRSDDGERALVESVTVTALSTSASYPVEQSAVDCSAQRRNTATLKCTTNPRLHG